MPSPSSAAQQHAGVTDRFREAMARFDAANAADPTLETVEGRSVPAAELYAQRMTARLRVFAPQASEALQLAVHAQHLERWKIARSAYPEGRKGYHAWRTALARYHAERAGEILLAAGYDPDLISRVQALLRKERLKLDAETQTLEDVACLVFLEHHFADFAQKHPDDKVVDIVRKTWHKMSPQGHDAALQLNLPPSALDLVKKALA